MEQIGVRGVVQKWIQSYVSNRQQIVKFSNGAHSQSLQNKVGVPQGSLLAPTLFLIMNNDLPLISPEDTLPVLYADDSNFVSDIENAQQIANNMQTWAATNCQSLNYGKTQFIHFTPRNKIENQSQLIKLAHGTSIKQVSATKFLGVHLDSKLNWSTHIETLCKNLNSLSFLFRQLRPYTSDATLLTLYYGQCYSKLVYGIVCWGNAPKVQSALIAQKNIIRQIENCSRRHSCKPLFLKYNLLTIVSIYILACSTYVKNRINEYPAQKDIHEHNTRNCKKLCVPQCRLTSTMSGPYQMSIKIFNKLPDTIKNISNINKFKLELKKMLLPKAYYSINEYFNDSF